MSRYGASTEAGVVADAVINAFPIAGVGVGACEGAVTGQVAVRASIGHRSSTSESGAVGARAAAGVGAVAGAGVGKDLKMQLYTKGRH